MSQDKSAFGLGSFVNVSNAQKRAKSMLGKEEPEQKEIIAPKTESIATQAPEPEPKPDEATADPVVEQKPVRSAEELERIIAEQQAQIESLRRDTKTSKAKAVPMVRDAEEQNICIRMNTLRKRYCKERAKQIGAEGGISAYINYLVAIDMRAHTDMVEDLEFWAGRDIPYVSVPPFKTRDEVFDETTEVDKAVRKNR